MSARKLIYRFMVCAPALFLAGLGVNARTLTSDFEPVANDPMTERGLLAYVPYLRDFRLGKAEHRDDVQSTRKLASSWITAWKEGDLRPVRPVATDDTSSDGAKSEIFQVESVLAARLDDSIRSSIAKGDLHTAASDAILAMQLAESVKYSDFLSIFNSASQQRRVLAQLQPVISKLEKSDCVEVGLALKGLRTDQRQIQMIADLSRRLFIDARERRQDPPLSIEDSQLLADIPAMINDSPGMSTRELRTRLLVCKDDQIPALASCLRLGINAQYLLDQKVRALSRQLAQ